MLECPNSWIKQVYFHFSSPLPCFVWRILSFTLTALKGRKKSFKLALNNVWCVRTVLYASTLALYWMELNLAGYRISAYRRGCFLYSSGEKQEGEGTTLL